MRQKKIFFLIILFAIFFAYITNIEKIPENITLFQNEKYQIGYLKGIEIEGESLEKKDNFWNKLATINTEFIGNLELKLSTLGGLFNKKITVNVVPSVEVIPGGDLIGVKLYSKGVLVVGESKVQGTDGNWYETFNSGTFKPGDLILKINDYAIEQASEISTIINNIGEKNVTITYERNGKILQELIKPIKSLENNEYKIGLWVRDGAMGIGTLTFYSPEYSSYAALGHGISDEDSKDLIEVDQGEVYDANVISIKQGKANNPGEIKGFLEDNNELGNIEINSKNGIYGNYENLDVNVLNREKITVASKNEVKLGKAKIRCTIDESQEIKEYDIEIVKISTSISGSKGMIIKVTDQELINKTGGIIQGMSGSPIIQNGKLVGAVTHVYIDSPTKGYAIFAESMLEEIKNK